MGITQVIFESEIPLPVQEIDWDNDIIGFCSPTLHGIKVMGDTKPHVIIDRQLQRITRFYDGENLEYIGEVISATVIHELLHYFSRLFDEDDEHDIKVMEIRMISWMRLNEKETK